MICFVLEQESIWSSMTVQENSKTLLVCDEHVGCVALGSTSGWDPVNKQPRAAFAWGCLKRFSASRSCELVLLSADQSFSCKAADKPSTSCSAHPSLLPCRRWWTPDTRTHWCRFWQQLGTLKAAVSASRASIWKRHMWRHRTHTSGVIAKDAFILISSHLLLFWPCKCTLLWVSFTHRQVQDLLCKCIRSFAISASAWCGWCGEEFKSQWVTAVAPACKVGIFF